MMILSPSSRRHARLIMASCCCALLLAPSAFAWTIEGIDIKETQLVDGAPMVLVGAGYHKRGYSKFTVAAIYATEKRQTLEGLSRLTGPKRLLIVSTRDIPSHTVSRYFVNDLQLHMSESEFKSLIPEITLIGQAFSKLRSLAKGDLIHIDWDPAKGMSASLNGEHVVWENGSLFIRNELLYNVFLRIHAGPKLSQELQRNMLGLSTSMRDSER